MEAGKREERSTQRSLTTESIRKAMLEGYGSFPTKAKHQPHRDSVPDQKIRNVLTLACAALLCLAIFMVRQSAVELEGDDYKESQVVYPSESTENYPSGEWSGDTGAEPSDQ